MVNKLCKACLQERPISDFGRDSQKRSGLRTYCRDCNNAKSRRYYAKNADLRKKYYETNKEEIYGKHKERQRKKKEANPEGFLEKQRETNRRYRRRHGSRATELAYRRRLQRVYGIDTDEYKSRLESQGNACAVCRNVPEGERLVVDHEHSTGKIRGLLCRKCNTALGLLQEDPEIAESAFSYLVLNRRKCS